MTPKGWIAVALGAILGGLVIGGFIAGKFGNGQFEITLPLLAMFGVLVLLMALALTSVSFAIFDLADKREALALPPGSVRAVIALGLVVIFAILTVFLYADLSGTNNLVISGLTLEQQKAFMLKLTADELKNVYIVPHPAPNAAAGNGGTAPSPGPSSSPPPGNALTYDLYRRDFPNSAAQDFAKQLLILLGTLLSSVTGFYFGAKTVSDKLVQNASETTPQPTKQGSGVSKLASTQNVAVTPEAASLGHDPELASGSTEGG